MSFETKAEFGVTFNPKMSSKQASNLWFTEVAPAVRNDPANAALNTQMLQCQAQSITASIKQAAYEIAQKAEDALQAIIDAAAAIAAGILNLPAQIAAKIAALLDINIEIGLAAGCKQLIHNEIDNIVPEYIPNN